MLSEIEIVRIAPRNGRSGDGECALPRLICYRTSIVSSQYLLAKVAAVEATMSRALTTTARDELVQAVRERYRAGSREAKKLILGEFAAVREGLKNWS